MSLQEHHYFKSQLSLPQVCRILFIFVNVNLNTFVCPIPVSETVLSSTPLFTSGNNNLNSKALVDLQSTSKFHKRISSGKHKWSNPYDCTGITASLCIIKAKAHYYEWKSQRELQISENEKILTKIGK